MPKIVNAKEVADKVSRDLERGVNMDDVIAHCMLRILNWEYRPGCENPNMVRDATYFFSSCNAPVNKGDINEALDYLRDRGYITLTYPDPENDPDGFIVRLAPRKRRE